MKIIKRCKRCNRILTNIKARKVGMGKICFEKDKIEKEQDLIKNATLEEFALWGAYDNEENI